MAMWVTSHVHAAVGTANNPLSYSQRCLYIARKVIRLFQQKLVQGFASYDARNILSVLN